MSPHNKISIARKHDKLAIVWIIGGGTTEFFPT
uniref:Uncharacterized protein n=1 Tax=Rhizophora mucronata TaxID=61149 RepID=A0A2P2R3D4_RHIMU